VLARLPFRGTLLNTLTVVVGALVGMALGKLVTDDLKTVALAGIGLICLGLGAKLLIDSKNLLITTIAIVGGGLIGALVGIDVGVDRFAESMRGMLGGDGNFNEGLISASVLFCVGPMTLLGCLKDGLERDIHLLAIKSVFDMIAAVFLAATLGAGVLVAGGVVLVVQGLLTALARPLKPLATNPQLAAEAGAAGGAIMLAIGIKLLGLRDDLRTEVFLPALVIAPLVAPLFLRKEEHSAAA
jgi:uncharacterized membrane protein YqgA involved in biofilm formation